MTKDETRLVILAAIFAALAFWKREEIQEIVTEALAGWKAARNAEKYLPLLNATEVKYGIPRDLLARVAYQESRFRDDIVNGTLASPAGALGIMQIVPKWHPDVNPLNVPAAIDYAGKYLASLKKQFGTWDAALGAYNWGPGNMSKYLAGSATMPTETKKYITDIAKDVLIA